MSQVIWMTQVRRGVLELCILNLLADQPMYGYQLVKHLTEVPGLVTTTGTVYPLLSRLKRQGLIGGKLVESSNGPVRRVYELTAAGRKYLRSINESWNQVADAVQKIMRRGDC